MTDAKHTPGDAVLGSSGTVQQVVTIGGKIRLTTVGGDDEANARRLVACWNACQGLSTEALEAGAISAAVAELKAPSAWEDRVSRALTALEGER